MKLLVRIYLVLMLVTIPLLDYAQCAMCRTQIVNNVSHGETTFAAGLNFGILYLFVTPYIAIGVVAFFWFKKARVNEQRKSLTGRIRG